MDPVITAAECFDWAQPSAAWAPCFHLEVDGHFCGRAPWWDGHVGGPSHHYISLADLLRTHKRMGRPVTLPGPIGDLSRAVGGVGHLATENARDPPNHLRLGPRSTHPQWAQSNPHRG